MPDDQMPALPEPMLPGDIASPWNACMHRAHCLDTAALCQRALEGEAEAKCARRQAVERAAVLEQRAKVLTNERIRELMLSHGFTIKDGLTDLKPYVYEAARAIEREATAALAQRVEALEADARRYRWLRNDMDNGDCVSVLDDAERHLLSGRALDAAIDAAIRASEGKG